MSRLQCIGGAFSNRSSIANAQRCVNYYPELNRKDSPTPFTYYQRPGLRPLVAGPPQPVRALFQASTGAAYCVIGQGVYTIDAAWALVLIGTLTVISGNPVSMVDNGIEVFIVDSSNLGYKIVLATNVFSQIIDGTGTFQGGNKVDFIDTFMLWNLLGTNQFGSTLSNTLSFNALYTAAKSGWPDPIASFVVNRHEILLLGRLKSEIWYDAGNALFPFSALPGAYIEHGCNATYSVASQDIETYWLSRDLQGTGIILSQKGYDTKRISNHALEYAIRKMSERTIITDAIGFTYQQDGHTFYSLNFPHGDETWVYDASIAEPELAWHQEGWTDANGVLHRMRSNCYANMNGLNVVGDWQNGTIYQLDPNSYTDTIGETAGPISFIKGYPHLMYGQSVKGELVQADGKRVQHSEFFLDMQCGNGPLDVNGDQAQVTLRWSDDRGVSFGNGVLQGTGEPGQFRTQPQWQGLGIAMDRVYEIEHSINGEAALNGAWVEGMVLEQ